MKRLLILLAVLPQLLLLSLGTGVCVGSGGHLQIEAVASACCAETQLAAPEALQEDEFAVAPAGDCSACTDLGISVDTGISRAPGERELDSAGSAALPVELSAPNGRWQPARVVHGGSQRTFEPRHLLHLRSILLRC